MLIMIEELVHHNCYKHTNTYMRNFLKRSGKSNIALSLKVKKHNAMKFSIGLAQRCSDIVENTKQ